MGEPVGRRRLHGACSGRRSSSARISTASSATERDHQFVCEEAATGAITSLAHAGDPASGGGTFRAASSPVNNDLGDVVFLGDTLVAPAFSENIGVYLNTGGNNVAVARRGDAMPGGGTFLNASIISSQQIHINNARDVVFNASLDVSPLATGLYKCSKGAVSLVARTGTVIPGVGTIDQLN
jgi:hypothetical protein